MTELNIVLYCVTKKLKKVSKNFDLLKFIRIFALSLLHNLYYIMLST